MFQARNLRTARREKPSAQPGGDPDTLGHLFIGEASYQSVGARALRDYAAHGMQGRLIRSIKKFCRS
jgi:hypothetical protein